MPSDLIIPHRYIARDDEELATLKAQRRPGRASTNPEDQFQSGFWMPDLRDSEGVAKLRAWKQDWSSLNTLKFARIGSESGIRASTFPPKGLS
jgi:translation machinery-associated protein 16